MASPFDDDQMFLRHIRQQIQEAQGGNLQNERLMKSLNRPTNMPSPFYTQTTPGDPGRFASPQPLNFPGSTIPKTTPGIPPQVGPMNSGPKPFMMPQTPDPRLQNSPYSMPNLVGKIFGGGASQLQPNQPLSPQVQQFMQMQKPGIDPTTRQWDREDEQSSMRNLLLRAIMGR